jgi:hypothetical protein
VLVLQSDGATIQNRDNSLTTVSRNREVDLLAQGELCAFSRSCRVAAGQEKLETLNTNVSIALLAYF